MSAAPPPRHRRTAAAAAGARTRRWEDRTAWPMFVLSIAFFAASIWLLGAKKPPVLTAALVALLIVVLWVVFIADFVVRLALARHRSAYLSRRWFEVLSLFVPYLRPFLIVAYVWRLPFFRRSPTHVRARFAVTIASFALVFVYVASTLVWFIERGDPKANIVDLEDAIWWGFTTITTVGYGDYTPVTPGGRFVAVLLMIGGIFVVGVTSATVVSFLTDQIRRVGGALSAQAEAAAAGAGDAVPSGETDAATRATGDPAPSTPGGPR